MRRVHISFLLVVTFCVPHTAFPNEYTDVIDAVDMVLGDPIDVHLTIGYSVNLKNGVIAREISNGDVQAHALDYYPYRNMFYFKHIQHVLDIELDVGVFRDVSLRFGLPLVLSDKRMLTVHEDWKIGPHAYSWSALPPSMGAGGADDELFGAFGPKRQVFKSPKRSGIDYFSVGIWGNPLDQSREPSYPNWTLFLEGRFGVGTPMRASCSTGQKVPDGNGGRIGCGDEAIDGVNKGGVSRGVYEIHAGTRLSRRFDKFDPFFGVDGKIGIPKKNADFVDSKNSEGQINTLPPIEGTLDFGLEVIPWEAPSVHRRLVIGIGGGATYHSEGREYTPLYDALGTSGYFLEQEAAVIGDSVEDVRDYEWTGMTDIENYATIFGRLFVLVEPAKYIKFRIGGQVSHDTQHFVTKTDMCSINKMMGVVTNRDQNECTAYNKAFRLDLDSPGGRFRAEQILVGRFFVDVSAMF